jgi:hypothetical protein
MPGGFLPLRQSALQPLVRAIREVGELPQGLKGLAPASQASQIRMHQLHAHGSRSDGRSHPLH